MAHFAQLNKNNIVLQVIVIDNKNAPTEQEGIDYIVNVLKLEGTWIQTSYNGNIRGKYAGVMDIYDPKKDKFTENLKYIEEQNKKALEEQKEIDAQLAQRKAIADKLGLTVEELSVIIHE